ncbi:MAG: 3-oxoacyl-[acyl-carrier-protein] reductase [Phycisphaerae bacterium]|nr:3-oxoacyl-[acyl-carrier-protein] reductase [Phycisphaerae bacterium]
MSELSGKVSLVTGGSRGIGRAIALALAEAGSDVAVNYASAVAAADDVVKQITAMGRKAKAYKANVGNAEDVHGMIEQVTKDLGPVTVLVNNAGITRDRSFAKLTLEQWTEVIDVNLNGQAFVTHAVLPGMLNAGWGRIIFISSVVGQMGNFGQSNYAAAKAGLIALTKSLAREVARKNITVNAVAPGYIETDMTAAVPAEAIEAVKKSTPVGRLGKAEEVAHAVLFLASPKAAYVTGETVSVNGGMYMM